MVRRSLDPWLARVLRQELRDVLEWWKGLDPRIKPDPDSRFRNDHSNLKSVLSPPSTANCIVQLVEVLSLANPAIVVLSDSQRTIRARLSPQVIATLEAETQEPFNADVTGDVFELRSFTVVSSLLAPSDERIQLVVDEIEYAHHLRRNEGSPHPIHDDDGISQLILRLPNPGSTNESDEPEPSSHDQVSASEPSVAVPRSSLPGESQDSNAQFQTQAQFQPRRKAPRPNLAEDGFVVEAGINLELPFQAAAGFSRHGRLPSDSRNNLNTERLKSLLQPKRAPPENAQKTAPQHFQQQSTNVVSETPTKLRGTQQHSASPKVISAQAVSSHSPVKPAQDKTPPSAQPLPASANTLRSSGSSRSVDPRRKIPSAQRKLLDHSSSWIPSIPGQRFPHPNVPIELLKAWNTPAPKTPSPRKSVLASSGTQQGANDDRNRRDSPDQSAAHDSSESSDEEFDWAPTPFKAKPDLPPDSSLDSAPQSPAGGELRVAPPRALEIGTSPIRPGRQEVRSSPAQAPRNSRNARPTVSGPDLDSMIPEYAHTMPPRGPFVKSTPLSSPYASLSQDRSSDKATSRSERLPPPSSTLVSQVSGTQGPQKRISPPSVGSTRGELARPSSNTTPHGLIHSSPQASPGTGLSQWRNKPMVGRRSLLSQASPRSDGILGNSEINGHGSTARVQASQQSPPIRKLDFGNVTMGSPLSNSTPTPPPLNPDEAHRIARRKFVQEQKMCDWLKARFSPSDFGHHSFQTVLAQYRNSHTDDKSVAARDFMKAVEAAFPASSPTLATTFRERSNGSPGHHDDICIWFNSRFHPDPGGEHQHKTIYLMFREQYKNTRITRNEMLDAMQTAFPDVEVTKTTKFTAHQPPASGLSLSRQSPLPRQERTNGQIHDSLPLSSPQLASESDRNGDDVQDTVIPEAPEAPSVMKEFCDSWLQIRPGGAFALPSRARPRGKVNVLRWNI